MNTVMGTVDSARAAGRDANRDCPVSWLVIANPVAGRSRSDARAWHTLERALRRSGLDYDIEWTTGPGDGARIAAAAWQRGCHRLLVAGGDGSAHDVVNGLMRARQVRPAVDPTHHLPTVVPLPLGTGNDWSRSLGLPDDPDGLARLLRRAQSVPHDVGRIEFEGQDGEPRMRVCWFINVAGAGFDAHVIERMAARVTSRFAYLAGALRELAQYRASTFTLAADQAPGSITGRLLLAFVANGRYCGGGMHVAPAARQDDGALDLVTIDDAGLLRVLPKLAKLYVGDLMRDPLVRHSRVTRVRIEANPVAGIEADGQLVGRTPAVFALEHGALLTLRGP